MDPWAAAIVNAVLDILLADAQKGLDTARKFRRADINSYTVGQVQYWEHAISTLKWAKGRVLQLKRKKALRGVLPAKTE